MTACRTCGHDPEPIKLAREHDPNWRRCPTCRGSEWRTTTSGTTRCQDCQHGFVPVDPDAPAPLPKTHTPIPGITARARQALNKETP